MRSLIDQHLHWDQTCSVFLFFYVWFNFIIIKHIQTAGYFLKHFFLWVAYFTILEIAFLRYRYVKDLDVCVHNNLFTHLVNDIVQWWEQARLLWIIYNTGIGNSILRYRYVKDFIVVTCNAYKFIYPSCKRCRQWWERARLL